MLVIHDESLVALESALGRAARSVVDNAGNRVDVPTIEARTMRIASIIALQIICGETVWDATKPLRLVKPRQPTGIINVIEE